MLRVAVALVLVGFLAVFFLPVVYDTNLYPCSGGLMCLSNPSGLKSLGYWLFGWGGTYSFELGYAAPPVGSLTTVGVLLFYVLPLVVACAVLVGPELVSMSKVTRTGFVAFGAFVFVMSVLFVLSMIPMVALLGIALALISGMMVVYGMRIWVFRADDLFQEEAGQP